MKHCLTKAELANEKIVKNTDSLLDSIFYKVIDLIAHFISAGGPECFQSKQENIQNCIAHMYSGNLQKTNQSYIDLIEQFAITDFRSRMQIRSTQSQRSI